ncbi:MAG: hypothetical protein GY754_13205 [bacterium]|nr:hypothetical protein [bacterium]
MKEKELKLRQIKSYNSKNEGEILTVESQDDEKESWHFYKDRSLIKKVKFVEHLREGKTIKVEFRNVGDEDTDATLQFVVEEYCTETNETNAISFSVPAEFSDLFISSLRKVD